MRREEEKKKKRREEEEEEAKDSTFDFRSIEKMDEKSKILERKRVKKRVKTTKLPRTLFWVLSALES